MSEEMYLLDSDTPEVLGADTVTVQVEVEVPAAEVPAITVFAAVSSRPLTMAF